MRLRLFAFLVVAFSLGAVGASTGTTAQAPVVSAGSFAVKVIVPGQPEAIAGGMTAPGPVTSGAADAFAYPADGSSVRTGALSASVFAQRAVAQAVSDVLAISLFNGEITAESVAARAKASAAAFDANGSSVTNLVLLGQPATPVAVGQTRR